jgi:hypothetical protein
MSSTLQLIVMLFIRAWGHSQGITMYGMKYTKSFVNLEPNEAQLDSNRSFELKRFWSFPNRIDFTSSLTRLDGNTTQGTWNQKT